MDEEIKSAQVEAAGKQSAVAEIEGRTYDVPSKIEYPFSKTDYDLSKANLDIERRRLHAAEEQTKERERLLLLREKQSLTSEVASLTNSIEQLAVRIAAHSRTPTVSQALTGYLSRTAVYEAQTDAECAR